MAKDIITFDDLTVRGPVSATRQEQMQAAIYGKYRIIKTLVENLESYRRMADNAFNEILAMKDEQGEAFNTDSYDYKSRKDTYLEYSTMD